MDVSACVARFMVHKVGAFVVKERVLCFAAQGFYTYDADAQQLTNSWSYADVASAAPLEGETDFVIATPRHRVKKTIYRCHYRMEVLVCLMRLRSQHEARSPAPRATLLPELRSYVFRCVKYHRRGLQSPCVVEIGPDGVYQRDEEGELMSHIPYTSLVSIDLVCDDHNAIVLNHSDNSSLFVVDKRTEMAQTIHRVMKAYSMDMNEYRKKTMEAATKGDATGTSDDSEISFQYPVTRVSATNKPLAPRILAVSEKYIAELIDNDVIISSRPLSRIFSLVLFGDSAEAFEIVFVDGIRRTFYSAHREKLVTELLASCHALKNTQVDVTIDRVPDALRMVPCKIIHSEGDKLSGGQTNKDVNVMDRELRIVQASILQQFANYGAKKTARSQRQLPMGIDEGFHALALEFNANTPTSGVIAQPNKPFEKAIFYVAREIRDIVNRHGPRQQFLVTYLQTLFRLLHASPAMKEFVGFVLERGDGYLTTITELLVGRHPVILYWTFQVLQRLLESKSHKIQVREVMLSSSAFLSTLFSLFDLDPKTQRYLSDLPVMKLCQFVLVLVKTNPERQLELSKVLHEQLARRSRMLHRILFGFPGLSTVEACVGILARMTKAPSSVSFEGDATEASSSSLIARAVEAPPLSMGFGEHLTFEPSANRHGSTRRALVARLGNVRSTRMGLSGPISTTSAVSETSGIAVQNPEVLLKQYRLFLEASSGPKKQGVDQYRDSTFLRLRYRCRNVFLQELMSHLIGSFDEFKRVFAVECFQFSGFLGKTSGQREKSDIYLTPRALVAVRVANRSTDEFEFRSIQRIFVPSDNRDVFAIIVKENHLYIYSEPRSQILEKMRELAGFVGIRLSFEESPQLPKPGHLAAEGRRPSGPMDWDPRSVVNVVKRSGRHGFFRFRKKQIVVINGMLFEDDQEKQKQKSFSLKDLRRVACVPSPHLDHNDLPTMIALDFADGMRVAYLSNSDSLLLANLYDGCLYCQNVWVTLSPEFTRVNPRLTTKSLLCRDAERSSFLNKDGMFVFVFRELSKDFERLSTDGSATPSVNATTFEKILFGLENLNFNVEEEDFGSTDADVKTAQLSFRTLFQGLVAMLKYATKPPMRFSEISVILESFCRVNDGCYRLAMDETHTRIDEFVTRLMAVIDSGDQLSTLWAIRALHSLSVDSRRGQTNKQAEKTVRALVLGHDRLVATLVSVLERGSQPLCSLAVLDFLYDVIIKARPNTDNNHFDEIIKRLSANAVRLQSMAAQATVVGLAVFSTGLLRVTLDNTDAKAHQRMCDAALKSGVTVRNLYNAFFFPTEAGRLTFRYIAAMWTVHHKDSFELLRRMLPRGMIRMITNPVVKKMFHSNENGNKRVKEAKGRKRREDNRGVGGADWFIRRMRQEIATYLPDSSSGLAAKVRDDGTRLNYPGESHGDLAVLADLLHQDFFLPDVIWNGRTREELKIVMERAISVVEGCSSSAGADRASFCWNHAQFKAEYPSIADEIEVDNIYLRVLVARIRDGSLHLDSGAKKLTAMQANGGPRGREPALAGESGHVLHSILSIVDAPRVFYDAVYQRWLEMRLRNHMDESEHIEKEVPQLRMSELCAEPAAEIGDNLLMKTLIEMAGSFPDVRSIPSHRVDFIMALVMKSFESRDIHNLVCLMASLSEDASVTDHLTKNLHLNTLLFLAVLSHRRALAPRSGLKAISDDGDEFPVIGFEMGDYASASSIPMTQLSADSRFALRWKLKMVEESDDLSVGPYSPIDLHQNLRQKISAISRLTVCCCTIHEKHDSNEHDWRLLHEVPELRWMELVTEPLDSADVGLKALTVLRNLVRNEPECSADGSEYLVPLPTGKKLLSAKEKMAHLVQLLLVDDAIVRKMTCEILLSLGPANGPKLFEFGLFFFIFSTDFATMDTDTTLFVSESKLLQLYHRVQDSREARAGQSYLQDMLPEALISLLDTEPPAYFADVFTGRVTDKRVLWTASMRQHLRSMVREHIEEFIEDLQRDVAVTYRYVSLPPVKYSELSRDVYCSGYFLSTIAEGDEASLDAIEDPQVLMSAIEEKWKALCERQTSTSFRSVEEESATAFKTFGWRSDQQFSMTDLRLRYRDLCKKGAAVSTVRSAYDSLSSLLERKLEISNGRTSDEVIECILLAQLRLLEKFSFQFFSYESRALRLLLGSIRSTTSEEKGGSKFGDLCVQILHRLVSSAPLNVQKLLSVEEAWDSLLDIIDIYAVSRNLTAKSAAFSVLQVVASSEHGPRSLLRGGGNAVNSSAPFARLFSDESEPATDEDDTLLFTGSGFHSQSKQLETAQSSRLCKTLERLLTAFEERQPWQIQKLLYGVVTSLCANNHFQEQLILSTKLFWRALYLLLSTAEDASRGPTSNVSVDDDVVALKERDVVEAAFHALRALSLGCDGQSRSQGLDALASLLPLSFLDCLDRPSGHDFWMILSTDIREPTCIWNDSTRSELMQLIADHCNHGDGEDELLFLESTTNYMYDCLKAEPFVGGIYLRILIEKGETDQEAINIDSLYPSTPQDFIQALFIFLNENRDPTVGIYADTLPALQCLNVLIDLPVFKEAIAEVLEQYVDDEDCESESVSVATLGRYLLPYDRSDKGGVSISSRRSLSSYGFMSKNGRQTDLDGLPPGMEAEFGNVDYLNRQEFALLILNKLCGLECDLERMFAPFCRYSWSLQVIADHLDYEQAFYALSCLAELCDTCLVVAEYVDKSGLWVEILGIAIQSRQHVLHEHFLRAEGLREPAFEVLYALLTKDFAIRESIYSGLGRFLPYPIVYQIHLDPSMAGKFFDDNHEKSDLIWNSYWRTEVRRKVDEVICRNRLERTKAKRDSVILDEEDYVHMPENFIAGLYLDNFLARPDPEDLTNPAYNLELLFQEWKDKLHCLMGFDLENPPQFLRDLAAEVDQLTTAMTHILRAPLGIEESIEAFDIPGDVLKLVRHCNKHVVAGFPYRCTLRIARQLANFSLMQSKDFLELVFCRVTIDHPDVPVIVKLLRRILDARKQALDDESPPFLLKDLVYFSSMTKYLESVAEKKESTDPKLFSNVNRVLRLIKEEQRNEARDVPMSQSFLQRMSTRWHNSTLMGIDSKMRANGIRESLGEVDIDEMISHRSFNVDAEHAHGRSSLIGTFNVDAERERDVDEPPRSYMFDGETIQEMPAAPRSFRFVNGVDEANPPANAPVRASLIRATYEPVDSQYHSSKAAQYERQEEEGAKQTRRASVSNMAEVEEAAEQVAELAPRATMEDASQTSGMMMSMYGGSEMNSSRRYSLLDSWRAPTSNQPNPLLSSMTISRRGRRATAVFSRRKAHQSGRWFGR